METSFILITISAAAVFIWLFMYVTRSDGNFELEEQYKRYLKGTDKRAALEAGRLYHQSLRKNKTLTLYDEMAIANDLSAMDVADDCIINKNGKSEGISLTLPE